MSHKIEIVITMGGLGSRFKKQGYTVPKYMIPAKGKTLFEWSLCSLSGYNPAVCQYIFVALQDRNTDVAGFLQAQCRALQLPAYKIILLDHLTDGQATTALLAEKYWNPAHELIIYNIDTYVEPGYLTSTDLKGDGFIPCFQAPGDHWSFVRLDPQGKVAEIKEKQRISKYCTLGAYYFKSCQLFADLYHGFYQQDVSLGTEKYVAPLYDYLLHQGGEIYITDIDSRHVHVLGTPEELAAFIKS